MLKQPVTKQAWRNGGLSLVLAMSLGTGFAAWSAQPAGPVDGTQGALQVTSHAAPTQGPVIESSAQAPAAAMPEVIKYVRPVYPKTAEVQQITGKVWLAFEVAPDGSVIDVTVDKSQPAEVFDAAALEAGRKWKFKASDKSQGKQMIRKAIVAVYFEAPKTFPPSSSQADDAATRSTEKDNLNLAAYDWTEYDLAANDGEQPTYCDVIKTHISHAQIGYCGTLKK